jgi:hypothetical protein
MIVEALMAALVMIVGIFGTLMTLVDSQKVSLVSERMSTMSHIAQQEIERIEGMPFASIELTAWPGTSTDPNNPDYWVTAGTPETFQWDRTAPSSEPLVEDATNGAVTPTQAWSEGSVSGTIYDFVTWTSDPRCSPGCSGTANYKRITVAVTTTAEVSPKVLYVSSVVADPNATPI